MAASATAGTGALTPLLWIFAASALALTGLFLLTGVLAARHRSQRKNWIAAYKEIPPEVIDVLTVGDLFMDPELRQKLGRGPPESPSVSTPST